MTVSSAYINMKQSQIVVVKPFKFSVKYSQIDKFLKFIQ